MNDEGSILLCRSIITSQVFAHQTALKIWIWCLCKASYKERFVPLRSGKGEITVPIKPGQFIFGRFTAEEELNIDGSTIYKWMQKFASEAFDNMITIKSNNQYSIVTICNWDIYQRIISSTVTTKEQPSNSEVTAKEQPKNTNNKVNKVNKVNNIEERSLAFKDSIFTYKEKYSEQMLLKFFNYWSEKNKSGLKMRFELQDVFEISKRLATWHSKEINFNNGINKQSDHRPEKRVNDYWNDQEV